MQLKRLPKVSLVLLACLAPLAADAVTLDEAIDLALKHDPGLRRAEAEADAYRAELARLRASASVVNEPPAGGTASTRRGHRTGQATTEP